MKVLIVDDEPALCTALSKTLRSWGYDVVVAHTAIEASTCVMQDPEIKAALIDWDLGGTVNGGRLARAFRRRGLAPLMISGYSKEEIRADWRDPLEGLFGFYDKGDPEFLNEIARDLTRIEASLEGTEP